LNEKLTSLSLVAGITMPTGPIAANPPAKAKHQNQKRIEPGAAMEPTTKACAKFVLKKTDKGDKNKKEAVGDRCNRIMNYLVNTAQDSISRDGKSSNGELHGTAMCHSELSDCELSNGRSLSDEPWQIKQCVSAHHCVSLRFCSSSCLSSHFGSHHCVVASHCVVTFCRVVMVH
jgi:hypothetical protein